MYLTAQHVRSADGTAEGVNVAWYTHYGMTVPGVDWRQPDVVRIADQARGNLMYVVPIVPIAHRPDNLVVSYLDVAVADVYPAQTVATLLAASPVGWNPNLPAPHVWAYGPMSLRLMAHPLLWAFPSLELRNLTNALLATLGAAATPGYTPALLNPPRTPICIIRQRGVAAFKYALTAESRAALLPLVGELPESASVTYQTLEAFRTFHGGELEPEVVRALTRLSVEQLDAIGGVYIMEGVATVWRSVGAPV